MKSVCFLLILQTGSDEIIEARVTQHSSTTHKPKSSQNDPTVNSTHLDPAGEELRVRGCSSPAVWRWHLLVTEEDFWAALWSQSVSMATEKGWKPAPRSGQLTAGVVTVWAENTKNWVSFLFFLFFYILQILQQSVLFSISWFVQIWGWAVRFQ